MNKKYLKNIFQILLIVMIFGFIIYNIQQNWGQIIAFKTNNYKINYYYLILSSVILFIHYVMAPIQFNLILKYLCKSGKFLKICHIYSSTELMRYIPGKIWPLLGRIYYGEKEGVKKYDMIAGSVIEILFYALSGLIVFFISLIFWPDISKLLHFYWIIIISPFFIFLLLPSVLNYFIKMGYKIFKIEKIQYSFSLSNNIVLLLIYCITWILGGMGLYLLGHFIFPISYRLLPIFIGIYSITAFLNMFLAITPAGLGIREGIMVYLLSFHIPFPVAMLISLILRIVTTLCELLRVGLFIKIKEK